MNALPTGLSSPTMQNGWKYVVYYHGGDRGAGTNSWAEAEYLLVPKAPTCPDGWQTFAQDGSQVKCFKYFTSKKIHTDAEADCQALGGHLASIHSIEEHNFIIQMASDYFWAGGVDANHDGVWVWLDGSNWDYSKWLSGQPDGNEYFLIISEEVGGDWRDCTVACGGGGHGYVCQLVL